MLKRSFFLIILFDLMVFTFFIHGSYESCSEDRYNENMYRRMNSDAVSARSRINMDLQSHIREIEKQLDDLVNHIPNYACPLYLQKQYKRLQHDKALLIYTQKTLEEKSY